MDMCCYRWFGAKKGYLWDQSCEVAVVWCQKEPFHAPKLGGGISINRTFWGGEVFMGIFNCKIYESGLFVMLCHEYFFGVVCVRHG